MYSQASLAEIKKSLIAFGMNSPLAVQLLSEAEAIVKQPAAKQEEWFLRKVVPALNHEGHQWADVLFCVNGLLRVMPQNIAAIDSVAKEVIAIFDDQLARLNQFPYQDNETRANIRRGICSFYETFHKDLEEALSKDFQVRFKALGAIEAEEDFLKIWAQKLLIQQMKRS